MRKWRLSSSNIFQQTVAATGANNPLRILPAQAVAHKRAACPRRAECLVEVGARRVSRGKRASPQFPFHDGTVRRESMAVKKLWRRGESNPRPRGLATRRLHA